MSGEIRPALVMVPGRTCDGCTMCCKVFEIPEIRKADGDWCGNCEIGKGCKIYESRPQTCRDFFCQYRHDPDVPEHWKPNRSHMVVKTDNTGEKLIVGVDPSWPRAWRETPYYQDLKRWSAHRLTAGKQIMVWVGQRAIIVLPDRDIDLGIVGGRTILTIHKQTPSGVQLAFEVVARDDPRVGTAAPAPKPPLVFRQP